MTKTDKTDSVPLSCYHCGEQVPDNCDFATLIDSINRPMCCPGCRAVAQLIAGSGLENFYQHRTAFNERPTSASPESAEHYLMYDDPEVYRFFTDTDERGRIHVRLLLGGMTCAACTWLVEQSLLKRPGVDSAVVKLAQNRLDVIFDPERVELSTLFQGIDALGYKTRPYQSNTRRALMADEYRTGLRQLAVAGLGMMQVGMFAVALHAGDIQGMEAEYQGLLRWVSLLVASFVVVYSGHPFFNSAWRHLKVGALVMDLPVSLAIGLAWLASIWATVTGQGQVYFDSAVMFIFFLLLGRFLERRARQNHELAWFDAESTLPASVKVLIDGNWRNTARQKLQHDDTILIPQGETVAVDARITEGESSLNESAFNGEQLPRAAAVGDMIYAGTVNIEKPLRASVLGSYADSRLAALQRSVERGESEKPAVAQLADRVASYFVGFVLLITAATVVVWLQLDPSKALWVALSVLVISCPCALALATPAALTGAASGLRRAGIIVQGENAIEALGNVSHLIFDKTGTLTSGDLRLCETRRQCEIPEPELLRVAASMQAFSRHPLARAFAHIQADIHFDDVQYIIGEGLEGHINGQCYRLGSARFCAQQGIDLDIPEDDQYYWIVLCRDQQCLAWFAFSDDIRPESAQLIRDVKEMGLTVELLTGDSSSLGQGIADQLHIDTVNRGMTPQQKMTHVQRLQRSGGIVAMVGDGLNDAPVLSVANASFAVAGATDLARTQADIILMDSDLRSVGNTLRQARRCHRIIRQNLGWALAYNLCGIPLAAMGYIPPWMAALGMSASSLLVVLNSLRLNNIAKLTGD
ncbi:MAG: heavy metal translocating P-type ATPase [Halioglobus sp.]